MEKLVRADTNFGLNCTTLLCWSVAGDARFFDLIFFCLSFSCDCSAVIYLFLTCVLPSMHDLSSWQGMVHLSIAGWLTFNVLFNYFHCIVTNPGNLPSVPVLDAGTEGIPGASYEMDIGGPSTPFPRWCKRCRKPKPPMTHHCHICKRCILKMDHHCRIPIINFVWRILSLMAFSILFCCYPAFICNPFLLNVFFLLCGLLFYLFIVGLLEVLEMPVFNWGRVLSLGVDIFNECTLLFWASP